MKAILLFFLGGLGVGLYTEPGPARAGVMAADLGTTDRTLVAFPPALR